MDAADLEPITIVITRVVRAGRENLFEKEIRDWIPKLIEFPGHQGILMLKPAANGQEYGAVLRFDSRTVWEEFRDSSVYRGFLERLREHLEEDQRVETVSGMEAFFPPRSATKVSTPRWKMALMTWIGVDITAFVLTFTLGSLIAGWPWFLGFLTFNAGVVAGLTWLVMPVLSRLGRRLLESNHAMSIEKSES